MKKIILMAVVACGSVLMSGCCSQCPASGRCAACPKERAVKAQAACPKERAVNTATLKALLDAKAPMTVVDARSGSYDDGNRIPGAKALAPDATEAQVAALLPDKQALVVTYCANLQCPASRMLAERLGKLGYGNVLEYPEGIAGWAAAGNKVEKAAR